MPIAPSIHCARDDRAHRIDLRGRRRRRRTSRRTRAAHRALADVHGGVRADAALSSIRRACAPMSIGPPPSLFVMTVVTPCMRYGEVRRRSLWRSRGRLRVRVRIDESRGDDQPRRVDRSRRRDAAAAASPTNAIRSPRDPDVGRPRGAPVPSTTRAAANQNVHALLRAEQRGQ